MCRPTETIPNVHAFDLQGSLSPPKPFSRLSVIVPSSLLESSPAAGVARSRASTGPRCPVRQSSFRQESRTNNGKALSSKQADPCPPVSFIVISDNDEISLAGSDISAFSIQEYDDDFFLFDDDEDLCRVRTPTTSNEEAPPTFPVRQNSIRNMGTNLWDETPSMMKRRSSTSTELPSVPRRKESSECLVGLLMAEASSKTLCTKTTIGTTSSTAPRLPRRRGSLLL